MKSHIGSDSVDISVSPGFLVIDPDSISDLLCWRWMAVDAIRWTESDVNHPPRTAPARESRTPKTAIGISHPAYVLFLEFVFRRIRRRISPQPKRREELVLFRFAAETRKLVFLKIR